MRKEILGDIITLKNDIMHQIECLDNDDNAGMWEVLDIGNWDSMFKTLERIESFLKESKND